MKNTKWLVGLAAVALLAGCGPTNPETTDKPVDPVEPGVMTTVKLSYNADYKVDVISEKGGMDGFKHDVDDKTVAELDLTKGDLYLYVKRDGKDGSNTSMHEALVHKAGEGYEFVTSTMENPRALKDEAAALAKIDELLHKTSYNLAGYVDLDTLTYSSDYTYEWKEFGLETPNQAAEDFSEPVREENAAGGQKVTVDLDYIGYKTDGGISDFPGRDGKPASKVTLNTNKDGFVTDYTQTLAAGLEMKIMTPAPLVTIDGSKTLSAEYGATLTKKDTIAHELTKGTVTLPNLTQGSLEVFTGKEATEAACTTKVENGAEVIVGEFLGVIVHPAGANTIKNLSNNDITVVDPKKDTMYFFEVQEGANKLGVNFVGDDVVETVKYATIKWTAPEGFTVTAKSYFMEDAGGQPSDWKDLPEDNKVAVGRFVGLTIKAPEGKAIDKVSYVDEEGATKVINEMFGQYSLKLKAEKEYVVTITGKDAAPAPETATIKVLHDDDVAVVATSFLLAGQDPSDFTPVPADGAVATGRWVGFKVTAPKGAEVESVKCNGKDLQVFAGQYCLNVTEAVEYTVTIKLVGRDAPVAKGTVKILKDADVTVAAASFLIGGQGAPSDIQPLPENGKVATGRWVGLTITAPEGAKVESVTVNGQAAQLIAGQYCFNVKDDVEYVATVKLEGREAPKAPATIKFNTPENTTVVATSFVLAGQNPSDFAPVPADGKVATGRWVGFKVTAPEGATVSVKCNGKDLQVFAGQYCLNVTEAVEYNVIITVTPAA